MSTIPRKVPPPCWTHEETLALIDSYRDKWYSLNRGNLRSVDWDAVALLVGRLCHLISPPKTAVQCRHKIEKLRKRYRTEKHRCLAFPGRCFSSWVFFPNMDSMENGPSSAIGSSRNADAGGGMINGNCSPNFDFNYASFGGFRAKVASADPNSVTVGFLPKNYRKVDAKSNANFNIGCDLGEIADVCGGFGEKALVDRSIVLPESNFNPNFDFDRSSKNVIAAPVDWNLVPAGLSSKNYQNVDAVSNSKFDSRTVNGCSSLVFGSGYVADGGVGASDGFRVKAPGDQNLVRSGLRAKNFGKTVGTSSPNVCRSSTLSTFKVGKRSGGTATAAVTVKREINPVAEMVSAIKFLGEGFVKMEKMKMEMARDMEKMRIEMEMKRIEMIMESQQQIADAFITRVLEKKKKAKVVLHDS